MDCLARLLGFPHAVATSDGTTSWGDRLLFALRKVLVATTGLTALLGLTGCQAKTYEGFSVAASGVVTVEDDYIVTLTHPAAGFVFGKVNGAAILASAKKQTHVYAGKGVSKAAVSFKHAGSTYTLRVAQQFSTPALLKAHYKQFSSAQLTLNDHRDPVSGVTTETLAVPTNDVFGVNGDAVSVKHSGHTWTFALTLTKADFTSIQHSYAEIRDEEQQAGLPASVIVAEYHLALPGTITATNGQKRSKGHVAWNLFTLKGRTLTASSKG